MMNKLFAGRMTSRTNLAGKSDFSAKQVSTTLLLLLLCLLMPQGTNAREIEYDFEALATNAHYQFNNTGTYTINHGSGYSGVSFTVSYQASTSFNSYTVDLSRFAFRSNNNEDGKGIKGWILQYDGDASPNKGLVYRGTEEHFIICDLRPEDEVTIYYHTTTGNNRTATLFFESGSASINGTNLSNGDVVCSSSSTSSQTATFKATSRGDVILYTTKANAWQTIISKIVITRPEGIPQYSYDPAIETYDLTGKTWTISQGESAGYSFATYAANYISNPIGYELNNRIAIQNGLSGSWSYANGLKSGTRYRLLGISDLRDGDRVRVTFSGNIKFSSRHEWDKIETSFLAAGKVFYDADNDGEQDSNEDVTITNAGTNVESGAWYTMLEAGHLDLAVDNGAIITKIEIYSDRKAAYIDTDNGDGSHTLTFDGTGQLVEKTAYIPGLRMEFGDASKEAEHFFVTLSDAGPVSWGYDHKKFLMARRSDNQTSLSKAPVTGTFYKFIPEISGTLNIDFKALSVKYGFALTNNDPSNEEITNASCPYVFIKVDANGSVTDMTPSNHNFGNGNLKRNYNNGFSLEKGYTYYFYGWWPGYENNNTNVIESCGVAKLLRATYTPSFMMPELACVTENGATSFDGSTSKPKIQITGSPQNLKLSVKKASENIDTSKISISLDNNGYLQITGISYKDDTKDHAGVILVSATANEGEHVFALTIPYSAAFNNGAGHRWDFYSEPLEIGNYFSDFYSNSKVQAKQKLTEDDIAGMGKNTSSQLYREIEKESGTDWTFTYRVVGSSGGVKDPMFQNVYDMCGDNADMIWETEGLWFDAPSNKSAIMNERLGNVDKTSSTDPDRYVAILPGSSFTIPALKAGDRVLIKMGSGDGSSGDACKLNITNALDAIGQVISESDVYNAGGNLWDYSGGTYDYRSAYHFISTGGDMTFTMNSGSMTKLYAIEIYRGDIRYSTDATRVPSQTYNGETYNANAWCLYNDYRTEDGQAKRAAYQLHFRGKGQRGRTPTVLHKSGNINTDDNLVYAELGATSAPYILFKSEKEQYGMFRMRIDDMELNNKYVAQYALQNVAVGYLQNKTYPYTWDFTDLMVYADTETRIQKERDNVDDYAPKTETGDYDIEFMNNSVGEDVKTVEQWKEYAADGNIPAGYGLHLRNENVNGGVMWESGQLYAGDEIFTETFGLSISAPGVHENYNGGLRITDEGLCLTGGNWKITIPEVGSTNAVYVRAHEIGDATAGVGAANTAFTYVGTATDGTNDKIYAVKGTGADMALFFNNLIIKKIAVSEDAKKVNSKGWTSESRSRNIDASLTAYMTGKDIKTYLVSNPDYKNRTLTLTDVGADASNYVLPANTGCVMYNATDNAAAEILDGGFHLFVPDMHDTEKVYNVTETNNLLTPNVSSEISLGMRNGSNVNYVLAYKYQQLKEDGTPYGDVMEGPEMFYRVSKSGIKVRANSAYLQLPEGKVHPDNTSMSAGAKFTFIFADELENDSQATGIEDIPARSTSAENGQPVWYNLNGQKLNGKPQQRGLYIVNGKKVLFK